MKTPEEISKRIQQFIEFEMWSGIGVPLFEAREEERLLAREAWHYGQEKFDMEKFTSVSEDYVKVMEKVNKLEKKLKK